MNTKQVYLHGSLGEEFGYGPITIDAPHIGIVVSGLAANLGPTFKQKIRDGRFEIIKGKVEDKDYILNDQITLGFKQDQVHIIPVIEGSGGNGGTQIILGVGLLCFAWWAAPAMMGATASGAAMGGVAWGATSAIGMSYGTMALIGAQMALGGLTQMLSPKPNTGNYASSGPATARASFIFNGAVNVTTQGGPVPLLYGRCVIGTTVIGSGLDVAQVPA